MATVINKTTKQILYSVNTPDFPEDQWIINPYIPEGVPIKYLKIIGDFVYEMEQAEKDAVDQAIADAQALADENAKDIDTMEKSFKALAILTFKEINKLRVEDGNSEYTWTQFKTAYKNEYDAV